MEFGIIQRNMNLFFTMIIGRKQKVKPMGGGTKKVKNPKGPRIYNPRSPLFYMTSEIQRF
jgi:hypothetical protein